MKTIIVLLTFFLNIRSMGATNSKNIPDSLSNCTLLIEEIWPGAFPQYDWEMSHIRKEKWHKRLREMEQKVNAQMKEIFEKYYKYDYKFVAHSEIGNFSKEEYPIALLVNSYSTSSTTMSGDGTLYNSSASGAHYYLYDRMLRTTYNGSVLVGLKRVSTIKVKRLVKRLNQAK